MGQIAGKASKRQYVEQAKSIKMDTQPLDQMRRTLAETGNMVTYRPAKGNLNRDRNVYAGDLSAEENATLPQIRPLVVLEYGRTSHIGIVKHGVTGAVLMMVVRELNDDPWYGGAKNESFRCNIGGQTEARLYVNGRPVGVNMGRAYMDVAPPPQAKSEQAELGASMIEMLKVQHSHSLSFHRRKKDNTAGTQLATYTRVRNGSSAVFKITTEAPMVDPLLLLVMAWFNDIEKA